MTTEPAVISFDYDQSAPLNVEVLGIEKRDGVQIKDIRFASPMGGRIAAFLVLPPESAPSGKHPGVLWVHWLEPHSQHSNREQFLDEAVALAKDGVISLLPDAFWSTTPSKSANKTQWGWKGEFEHDREVSIKQVIELRRSLDVLLAQEGIDTERIGYVGHDFGAMYGSLVAASDQRPDFYVLMAGTYSFGDWFVFGSGLEGERREAYLKEIAVLDPTRFIAKAAPAKLYFQFAKSDYYVPERAAQVFYDAATEPKEIAWYEAAHDLEDMEKHSSADRTAWIRMQLGLA